MDAEPALVGALPAPARPARPPSPQRGRPAAPGGTHQPGNFPFLAGSVEAWDRRGD